MLEVPKDAMADPPAGNERLWRFIIIKGRKTLAEVPRFHPYSAMICLMGLMPPSWPTATYRTSDTKGPAYRIAQKPLKVY